MSNFKPNPRPKKYATAADKQAAYRARYAVIEIRLETETADTLARIAEAWDVPRTEVVNNILKFGLLNRNWFTEGRFRNAKWLPYEDVPAGGLGMAKRAPLKRRTIAVDDDGEAGDE